MKAKSNISLHYYSIVALPKTNLTNLIDRIEKDAGQNITDVASQLVATSQNITAALQSNIENVTQAMHADSENWKQEMKSMKDEIKNMQQQQQEMIKRNELERNNLKARDTNILNSIVISIVLCT